MTQNEPISLIFLAFNEAKTIEKEIRSFYKKIIEKLPGSEFIVAEDGSTDGTTGIIQRLSKELGIIHLHQKERKGYANALTNAVLSARNEYVFFSDTGLKHDPDDFWKLYELRKNHDLIVGRKTNRQDQIYRKILTHSYNRYLRRKFGIRNVYDADSGFRLFNRSVIEKIFKPGLSFKSFIGSEVVLRAILCGLRYKEVPVKYFKREGVSRGAPISSIPRQIRRVLKDLKELKKSCPLLENKVPELNKR